MASWRRFALHYCFYSIGVLLYYTFYIGGATIRRYLVQGTLVLVVVMQ